MFHGQTAGSSWILVLVFPGPTLSFHFLIVTIEEITEHLLYTDSILDTLCSHEPDLFFHLQISKCLREYEPWATLTVLCQGGRDEAGVTCLAQWARPGLQMAVPSVYMRSHLPGCFLRSLPYCSVPGCGGQRQKGL